MGMSPTALIIPIVAQLPRHIAASFTGRAHDVPRLDPSMMLRAKNMDTDNASSTDHVSRSSFDSQPSLDC